MFSLNYKVTVSMCDADGRLKLFSALQMMQDCSELWKTSEPEYDRRIVLPKINAEYSTLYKVVKNDIDYNRHMNNANYVRLALELLPDGFEPRNMRVEFKKPAKLADELILDVFNADDAIFVVERLGDQVSTIIEFMKG